MGFALSRFQMLAGLCSDPDNAYNTFRSFKIVGVIVHNPEDYEFTDTMKLNFERLHKKTGNDFAFITFLDPPNIWGNRHGEWMMRQQNFIYGENCEDAEFVSLLRNRLNLPQCPVLVLTTDLLSNQYVILPTDEFKVVEQLERIASALSGFHFDGGRAVNDNKFIKFLNEIGKPHRTSTEDGKSLARNIADLIAVRSLDGQGIDNEVKFGGNSFTRELACGSQKEDARVWVKNTLRELKEALDDAREEGGEYDIERAQRRYSDYLAEYCANKDGCSPVAMQYLIGGSLPHLRTIYEKDAINAIYSYNRLVPFLLRNMDSPQYDSPDYGIDDENITTDLSPLGMYLGDIVEDEINASIIQFLRQTKGIPMPEFYRIYDPGRSPIPIQTKTKRIFLNKKGKLITDNVIGVGSLPIGDSNCVLRKLSDDGKLNDTIRRICDETYLNLLSAFGYNRNDATHSGIMDIREFDTMYNRFLQIANVYIPQMVNLKRMLKRH